MKTKCYVEGAEEIGNDVVLKCKSEEGSPVISYYWKKLDATEQLPATSVPSMLTLTVCILFYLTQKLRQMPVVHCDPRN